MPETNLQVRLARRPQGAVSEDDFRLVDVPLGEPGPGHVLVRNRWLSLDPYMRGRMSDAKSYAPSVKLDEVMVGQTVGEVVASRDPDLKPGDVVLTQLGWQRFGVAPAAEVRLFEIGQPKAGETVVVSAASGAVGSVVGQLARLHGCRVVGIAGGREKCDYVVQTLSFDACVDHRGGKLLDDLRAACPKGVDVDFENVGGATLDTLLRLTNVYGRIVVCGLVSEYNATTPYAYTNLRSVLVNRLRMQGMIVFDWKDRYGEALKGLSALVREGRLKYRESIVEGLENAPKGLIALLKGENFGKQVVRL